MRRRNNLARSRWTVRFLMGAGLLAMLSQPAVCSGLTSAQLQQRSGDVERMSAIERARLQRNWETFQKFSPAEKQRYRALNQELEQDRGQLKQLVTTYTQWLQLLTPGQRQDLQEAKDPAQKLALVKKFKEEQDQQQEGLFLNEEIPASARDRRLRSTLRRMLPRHRAPLSSSDLNTVMDALADRLSAADQARIKNLGKWPRYRQILEGSAAQAGGLAEWPSPDQQEIVRLGQREAEPPRNREPDPTRNSDRADDFRRGLAGRLIIGSLIAEMLHDSKAYYPKEEELQKILQSLDNDEKDKLIRSSKSELEDELLKKYDHQRTDAEYLEFKQTKQEFLNFLFRFVRESHLGGGFGGRGGPPGNGPFRDFGRGAPTNGQ